MLSSSVTAGSDSFAVAPNEPPTRYEHLHLHMVRTHWATKQHENLGAVLQNALDTLDGEGWEVVAAFNTGTMPDVILRRRRAAV